MSETSRILDRPRRGGASEQWTEHWRDLAEVTPLNPAQAYRRRLVLRSLALHPETGPVRLLDLGSGTGELAQDILRSRPDASVLGLDCSRSGIDLASRSVPNARFVQQDFTEPLGVDPAYRSWATHAVCSEVLEHLDDPTAALRNVRPLLAPGCTFVVTVPSGPMSAFDKHIGHRRHFDSRSLRRTLEEAGFVVRDLRGAGFPFFNLYRLVVVARGAKLVSDASPPPGASVPLAARAAMRAFSVLFKLNSSRTHWGWQLVAVASPSKATGVGGGS